MRLILNVVRLVFGGLWMAARYLLAALLSFLRIVIMIPASLMPLGTQILPVDSTRSAPVAV